MIKSDNLDESHEGVPVIDSVSDGSLDDANQGIPIVLAEALVSEVIIKKVNVFIIT